MRSCKRLTHAGLLAAFALSACSPGESAIAIEQAWLRAPPAGAPTAAVYLTIANTGSGDDALVAVSTPAAGRASLHATREENGMVEMRAIERLAVPAGERVSLKPQGRHIMLEALEARPEPGEQIVLRLTFENAGEREIAVPVRPVDARGPEG